MDRKSLEIAVHPNKRVVVKAPSGYSIDIIQERVAKRARWITKQIAYFKRFEPITPRENMSAAKATFTWAENTVSKSLLQAETKCY